MKRDKGYALMLFALTLCVSTVGFTIISDTSAFLAVFIVPFSLVLSLVGLSMIYKS